MSTAVNREKHCTQVPRSGMSRLACTRFAGCAGMSRGLLVAAGAWPFAGGRSARSTKSSARMSSTRFRSRAGRPGATTTVLRWAAGGCVAPVAVKPMEVREVAGGSLGGQWLRASNMLWARTLWSAWT